MGAHAPLSPSSAKRWICCPGSVPLTANLPEPGSSYFAAEGSLAHAIAEQRLLGQLEAAPAPGETFQQDGHEITWDESLTFAVDTYVNYITELQAKVLDAVLWIEERVVLVPELVWGTSDAILWDKYARTLHIIDLKAGRGVLVSPEAEQVLVYALAAINTHKLKPLRVVTHIVQPRAPGGETPQKAEWALVDLALWRAEVLNPALDRIAAGDTTLSAGEHCKFCLAKPTCPELHQRALVAARMDFEVKPVLPPEPVQMNDDELGFAMSQAHVMEQWIDAIRAEISQRLDVGKAIPGWKLVPKRAVRKWRNEDAAKSYLLESGVEESEIMSRPALKSVAQVEKAIKGFREMEEFLVEKISSGTTLAPAGDPRQHVLKGPIHEFSVLTKFEED